MAAFTTTALPHPSGLQGGPARAFCCWPAATAQLQPLATPWLDWQQDRQKAKEQEHNSFPSHPTAGCDPHNKNSCPIYKKITSPLSFHRCMTVPWKSTELFFSTTWKELYFWKNRVRGKRATGLLWMGCLKQEPGKTQADKSVCRQPRHKKSSSSQMRWTKYHTVLHQNTQKHGLAFI